MKTCYVGFDTSNYTTSVAVCTADGEIVLNAKRPLPVPQGERGLRQSDALFAHVKNLPSLCEELRAFLLGYTPVAVGVSATPRDAEGSYMPCFLAGVAAANAFAASDNLPVHRFSHQNGHIMAALYSSGNAEKLLSDPFLSFHVSGGTTELLLVCPSGNDLDVQLIGESDDINAGQAIDRVGVAMGLDFPCGRALEALAASYQGKPYRHPVTVRDGKCSLSGVENIAMKILREGGSKEEVAAFVFDFILRTLTKMGQDACEQYGRMPVLFAGGVMSNYWMRESLSKSFDAYFAEPAFSADNAAGVALLCRRAAMGETT